VGIVDPAGDELPAGCSFVCCRAAKAPTWLSSSVPVLVRGPLHPALEQDPLLLGSVSE
jgi:hypothetical protein